jgi:2-dehydro-3-deoxyphosphogluconate aldolase/(4S)-4-hydroxy-2-oxoglutarate aldolase
LLSRRPARVYIVGDAPANLRERRLSMSRDRLTVLNALIAQGVVPIFSHIDEEVCRNVIKACADGGAKCIEFTNRGDFAGDTFLRLARHFAKADPSVILGVGSIVDAPTAALYIANGASFIVGPVLNPEVARLCNRRKIAYIPGCGTASEISMAEELGCEFVKLFPGDSAGGPGFVKAVLGPMPWTRIMPTGGVDTTEASLRAWFDAGVAAVGVGSNLITKSMIEAKDYAGIEKKTRATLELVREVRGK